jgi:hypothetical protein
MGLVKIKPNDSYIHRFSYPTDKYKVIFIGFKTDEFKITDECVSSLGCASSRRVRGSNLLGSSIGERKRESGRSRLKTRSEFFL